MGVTYPKGPNRFRALRCQVRWDDQSVQLSREVKAALKLEAGDRLSVVPFE